MESEIVKEIKECLEVLNEYGETYITKDQTQRKFVNYADILTYINELESKNERLLEDNRILSENDTLLEMVALLSKEKGILLNKIAELEKEIKGNVFYAKGYAEGIKNTYEVVMPNKLKQFAERLKEITCEMYLKEQLHHCIDETLKEFLGK